MFTAICEVPWFFRFSVCDVWRIALRASNNRALKARKLTPVRIWRMLSALSSLFEYLYERNAIAGNPVDGVKRPMANGNEGSTPALGDAQAAASACAESRLFPL